MKVIRWILGQIILILDFLTSPKAVVREAEEQRAIDDVTASMSMYQFKTCPFCVKVQHHFWHHAAQYAARDALIHAEL